MKIEMINRNNLAYVGTYEGEVVPLQRAKINTHDKGPFTVINVEYDTYPNGTMVAILYVIPWKEHHENS